MFKVSGGGGWCGMAILLALLFLPNQSQAALIWDFTITGADLSGSGHIEFTADSSDTGEVADFSYEGLIAGHTWSCDGTGCFDAAPVWEINGLWGIDIMDLWIEQAGGGYVFNLGVVYDGSWMASGTYRNRGTTYGPYYGVPAYTHDMVVPAPATLALFGIGLAGLGWLRRKKN